jgi:hypothetical protein
VATTLALPLLSAQETSTPEGTAPKPCAMLCCAPLPVCTADRSRWSLLIEEFDPVDYPATVAKGRMTGQPSETCFLVRTSSGLSERPRAIFSDYAFN